MLYFIEINENIFNKFSQLTEKFNEHTTEGLSHQIIIKQKILDKYIKIHPRLKSLTN